MTGFWSNGDEEHSLLADEDDTSEGGKTQSATAACDDAEKPSAAEHEIGAWPIGMLLAVAAPHGVWGPVPPIIGGFRV